MMTPHFVEFYPNRPVDASHPDVLLDFNRCIQCELCVRASRDIDGKSVFALAGRGMASHIIVNSPTGRLGDTEFLTPPTRPRTSARSAPFSSSASASRRRSANASTTSSRSAKKRRAARWEQGNERIRRNRRLAESAPRDDLARRLLRLPYVIARYRRAHSRPREDRRIRPLAAHRHQALRPLRHCADRRGRLQRRERACAARVARQLQDLGRRRRLRDQRRPAGDAQPSRRRRYS